ncbi:hypothetical protein WJX73_006494 [Symbiochloris irregularis]|uniref:Protein SYS1 homolog n=1 Tax=Symbiochloris irregularis TaxID=706552 RepID=A0AAW1NVX4_9CHLO
MFYGNSTWDPVLIIAQIISLQCLFYISLGLLLWLLVGPYAMHLTLEHFFDSQLVNFNAFGGWMVSLSNVINALASALYLMYVVQRAKKCLDFAATLYFIHLAAVSVISGFPRTASWWIVNVTAFVICAALGEWLCVQRELQEIPIGSAAHRRRQAQSGSGRERDIEAQPLTS